MSYTKVNVAKPGDNKGVGGNKKGRIILFDIEDVATGWGRDANAITMSNNLTFAPGAYMVTLYATQHTIKVGSDAEGDPDSKGVIQNLEFSHPGNSVEIRAARQYWMNRNIGAIVESCDGLQTVLLGTPCAPLQLVFKGEDDKEKSATTMTFKSTQKGPDIAEYQGTTTFDTVTDTVAADETDIDLTNGSGEYQLTVGTAAAAAVATMSNPSDGLVFTLLGSGGTYPSTIAGTGTSFLMRSGAAWTALSGSSITFRVFKDGASTYKAIELSRA
jgi:hypothetical protein